ncbi:MAG: nuclear transport factor 2 family protein [Burkholderiales bacterium]
MSRKTIETFYSAFADLDGKAMQACYAEDASFRDEAFTLAGRREIGGMWRMLTDTTRTRARDAWKLTYSQVTDASAHWEAHYRFTATGRLVHNIIEARFSFDDAGLIKTHVDSFDFWRWSRQALGAPGMLLGWTPFLRAKVRQQAAANLKKFLAANP